MFGFGWSNKGVLLRAPPRLRRTRLAFGSSDGGCCGLSSGGGGARLLDRPVWGPRRECDGSRESPAEAHRDPTRRQPWEVCDVCGI